jgi:sodium-dependent dicarboxylate transporter 2/3/5
MLFILTLSALLWFFEAVPAFSVGILVIALQILLLGNPEAGIFAQKEDDWHTFVVVLGNPLIWLFFGGFVLSAAIAKTGLDRWLANRLLGWCGTSPSSLLFGVMAGSMIFSMFMSNTATTAMMLAVIAPVIAGLGKDNRFAKGLLLGVPFAANLGGMATLIGSPPNAIAAGALADVPGQQVDFLDWMLLGLPPAALLFAITWLYLRARYPSPAAELDASALEEATSLNVSEQKNVPVWQGTLTTVTLLVTVGLWMTGQWTGLPTAVVSFVPITILTATGILQAPDVRKLPWDILLLLAGGLALGNGVRDTGLADWLVAALPLEGLGQYGVIFLLCFVTVVLSNLMSNTAAANILVPIAVVMASGFEALAVVPLALCASCAMCLPISTPPNAIAFSTGKLRSSDFLAGGALVGVVAPLVTIGWNALMLDWVLGLG